MQIKVETEVGQTLSRADLERLLRRRVFAGKRTVEHGTCGEVFVRVLARFEMTDDPDMYRRVA